MQLPQLPPLPPFLEKHKTLFSSGLGALVLAGVGAYIAYSIVGNSGSVTIEKNANQNLLNEVSPGFVVFLQAMNSEKPSLKDLSFMDSYLVRHSQDFTQIINPSVFRGRIDPFTPYAASGSTR